MARKIEVTDDFRVQERDRVGGDGIAEAGVEFLGDRRAADLSAALEHDDFEPRGSEIGRGDKAIVTPANDDDVAHAISLQACPGGRSADRRSGFFDNAGLLAGAHYSHPSLRVKDQSARLRRWPLWG